MSQMPKHYKTQIRNFLPQRKTPSGYFTVTYFVSQIRKLNGLVDQASMEIFTHNFWQQISVISVLWREVGNRGTLLIPSIPYPAL